MATQRRPQPNSRPQAPTTTAPRVQPPNPEPATTEPPVEPQAPETPVDGAQPPTIDSVDAEGDVELHQDYGVVEPKGRILDVGDDLVFDGTPTIHGTIVANENVYRRIFPRRAKRPIFIQLVHEGAEIPAGSVNVVARPQVNI